MKTGTPHLFVKRVLPVVLVGALAPVAVAELPDADTVLANCVEAVGGREAIDNVETLHIKATMSMMGMQMDMEQAWSKDGGRLVTTKMPMGESTMGTDGETAWMKAGERYMLVPEAQAKQMESQVGIFMFLLDPKTFGKDDIDTITVVGEEELDGKNCYKLQYVGAEDKEGHVYFDVDSGLPVGFVQQQGGADGDKSTMLMKDWKEVEGVKFFNVIAMEVQPGKNSRMGGPPGPDGKPKSMKGELKVSELHVNSLDEDFFELPEEVKKLTATKADDDDAGDSAGDEGDAAPAEIKLEDLTPQHQDEAQRMLSGILQMQGTDMIKRVLADMEPSVAHMPAERKKLMQYIVQELKKELAKRGG